MKTLEATEVYSESIAKKVGTGPREFGNFKIG